MHPLIYWEGATSKRDYIKILTQWETIMYTPNPIQTDDISLSDDLLALTELIAANVHDVWAAGRIKEGWTYGEVKDAEKKNTPCLVPYDELPESEKEYDRNTAKETLNLITKLGYVITKKNG